MHDHLWFDIAVVVGIPAIAYCFWELSRQT